MVASSNGVQAGVVTFHGRLVDKLVASLLHMPAMDLNIMLTADN